MMRNKYVQMLVAVLAGNAIFFSVSPFLPERFQHSPFAMVDLGLVIDFVLCTILWIWIRGKYMEPN